MKLKPKMSVSSQKALWYKRYTDLESAYNEKAVYKTDDNKLWLFDRNTESFVEITEPITQVFVKVATSPIQTLLVFKGKYFAYGRFGWERTYSPIIETAYGVGYNEKPTTLHVYKAKDSIVGYYFEYVNLPNHSGGGTHLGYGAIPIDLNNVVDNKITIDNVERTLIYHESKEYTLYEISGYNYKLSWNGTSWNTENSTILPQSTSLNALFSTIATKYQLNKYYYIGCFSFMYKGDIESTITQPIKGNILPLTSLNIKYYDDSIDLKDGDFVVIDNRLYSVENPTTTYKLQPKRYAIHFATLNSVV